MTVAEIPLGVSIVAPSLYPPDSTSRTQITVRPTDIKLHQKSRILEVAFDDGSHFKLPCEYLRVYSPSAEVRGHSPGQEVLQAGKENVNISHIEPVGTYPICLFLHDG